MPQNQHRFAKLFRELTGKTTHELAPATDTRRLSQYWRDRTLHQFEAMFTHAWTCPKCGAVHEVMKTTRCC